MNKDHIKDSLISQLGLDDLPEDRKAALAIKMAETIQTRLMLRLNDMLSESDKKKLDELTENNDEKKIADFLESRFPDLDRITTEEFEGYKAEMLREVENVKKATRDLKESK